jgi:hypothetical protein
MANVEMPDLTPEQYEAVRRRVLAEEGLDKQDEKLQVKVKAEEEFVFTNTTNTDVSIEDLGIRSPSGQFRSEVFAPYECKNLREYYTPKEIAKSKYLILAQKKDMIKKGRWTKDQLASNDDPLALMARSNPDGTFTDPREVGNSPNHFDQKLRELQEKDAREDQETRKR